MAPPARNAADRVTSPVTYTWSVCSQSEGLMEMFTGERLIAHLLMLRSAGVDARAAFILFPPPQGLKDDIKKMISEGRGDTHALRALLESL